MKSTVGSYKEDDVRISKKDLRQLVFWASYGIGKVKTGSYRKTVVEVIVKWNKLIGCGLRKRDIGFGTWI